MADILPFHSQKTTGKPNSDIEALVAMATAVASSTGASDEAIAHISEWVQAFWEKNKASMEAGVTIPTDLPHDAAISMLNELRSIYKSIVQELMLQAMLLELDVFELRRASSEGNVE